MQPSVQRGLSWGDTPVEFAGKNTKTINDALKNDSNNNARAVPGITKDNK